MSPPVRVLVFDFDGVIVESNSVKTRAFERVFGDYPEHTNAMMDFHHANVSASRFVKFEHLAARMGRPDDQILVAQMADAFSRCVSSEMMVVPFVPGALRLLAAVRNRLPVYLASITPEPELKAILARRDLDKWFCGIYGCPPWTKPRAIADILSRENVAPDQVLLIGDSAGDQRAATETGIQFLARDSGLPFDTPPKHCYKDLDEIHEYLKVALQ